MVVEILLLSHVGISMKMNQGRILGRGGKQGSGRRCRCSLLPSLCSCPRSPAHSICSLSGLELIILHTYMNIYINEC